LTSDLEPNSLRFTAARQLRWLAFLDEHKEELVRLDEQGQRWRLAALDLEFARAERVRAALPGDRLHWTGDRGFRR
jgi:hypothetical protein